MSIAAPHGNTVFTPARVIWLDGLRGLATLAMVIYHFGFDLNFYGWLHQDLNHDWRWQTARALILGSFLFAVGCSHALTFAHSLPRAQRWQRLIRLTAAAALVSLGSYLMFPRSAIWFGTLHAITVMSLLLWAMERWRLSNAQLAWLAIVILLLGNFYNHHFFDQPWLSWIGLRTHRPITEDYVPLLPWFACCLWGLIYTRHRLQQNIDSGIITGQKLKLLFWLGRHSLLVYLVHQPVLLGLLWLVQHFQFVKIS